MRPGTADRGVSDVLGFILIFTLIMLSVVTIYTFGYGQLRETRDAARVDNVERAFDVLATNVADIRRGDAPSRATEIRLSGGTLRSGSRMYVDVTGDHDSSDTGSERDFTTGNTTIYPIVYEADDGRSIRYVAGGVLRTSGRGNAAVVREPSLLTNPYRVHVPLVQTLEAQSSIGGQTAAHIRTVERLTNPVASQSRGTYDEVTITVGRTPYPEAWRSSLESQGLDCDPPTDLSPAVAGDDTVTCAIQDVRRVYVVVLRLGVTIS